MALAVGRPGGGGVGGGPPPPMDAGPPLEVLDDKAVAEMRKAAHREVYERLVLVENVPKAGSDKYQKLSVMIERLAREAGELGERGVVLPRDENGGSRGFALIEFRNVKAARGCVARMHMLPLDKSHELRAMPFTEVQRVLNTCDEFKVPTQLSPARTEEFIRTLDPLSWLRDERGREQFAMVQENNAVEIMWYDSIAADTVYAREHWTDSVVMWSPLGSYLVTFHMQGLVLWGGAEWNRIARFAHGGVRQAQFSPNERYVVTYNGMTMEQDNPRDPQALVVWEVLTRRRLRAFTVKPPREGEAMTPGGQLFKWSPDGKYFARLAEDSISVYSTPDMGLLDKRSLKVPGVMDFEWSPSDNIIAYWTPEVGDVPARVTLVEMPSRRELRHMGLFSVADIRLIWKSDGDFLAIKVERFAKNRKVRYVNFELVRMRNKNYPIDTLDFKEKDNVHALNWEPKGNRFTVIHGDPPSRSDVSVYSMDSTADGKVRHVYTLEKKAMNRVLWSPVGTYFVLCRLGNPNEALNGVFEWYSANDPELLNQAEHFSATGLVWDPSGRFAASFTEYTKTKLDNGYSIWNLIGKQLSTVSMDKLYQFIWRPRPKLLLSQQEESKVKKNIKAYRERYDREDEDLRESRRSGKAALRRELRELWSQYLEKFGAEPASDVTDEDDDEYEVIEEVNDELIEQEEFVDYNRKMLTSDDERD